MTSESGEARQFGQAIGGGKEKRDYLNYLESKYRSQIEPNNWKVAVLKFESPTYDSPNLEQVRELRNYQSADDSARQKIPAFEKLGFKVPRQLSDLESYSGQTDDSLNRVNLQALPQNLTPEEFNKIINRLNQDASVKGIIIQNPVPEKLYPSIPLIAPHKSWDAQSANSPFAVPATSEAITRVAKQFLEVPPESAQPADRLELSTAEAVVRELSPNLDPTVVVAVVGSKGFVGRGVMQWLESQGVQTIGIDVRGDKKLYPEDLDRVWDADIIVSATGQPGLLTERHLLPQHRVVIDCGYVPVGTEKFGDVNRSAQAIPQHYTPVPGGTGPMEMIILGERAIIATVDPTLAQSAWQLPSREFLGREAIHQLQLQWAQDLYPTAQALFDRHADAVQATGAERILVVAGEGDYCIYMNDADQTLMILAAGKRQLASNEASVLARFNRITGEVEGAIKLNEQDHRRWRSIAGSLSPIDRTMRSDAIDRTEPDEPDALDNPPPSAPVRPRPTPQTPSGGLNALDNSSTAPEPTSTPTNTIAKDSIAPSDAAQSKIQADPLDLTSSSPSTLQAPSQQQVSIAREIYPVALELFQHPSATEVAPGTKEFKGDYRLVLDTNNHQLSVHRNTPTGQVLAQYDTKTGQVLTAQGLTESDRRSWREVAKEIDLQSQLPSRSSPSQSSQSANEMRSNEPKSDARAKPKQQRKEDHER